MTQQKSESEPELLGKVAKQVANRPSTGSEIACRNKPESLPAMPPRTTRKEFAKAMLHLAALKRTAALDESQVLAWHNGLGSFSAEVLNHAVLELAVTENRFPEFGDLYQACRKLAMRAGQLTKKYSPHGLDKEQAEVTTEEIRAIAARFDLKVL